MRLLQRGAAGRNAGSALEELEEAIQAHLPAEQPPAVIHHGYPEVGHSILDVLQIVLGADDTDLLSDLEGELKEQWSECEDDDPFFIEQTYASSHLRDLQDAHEQQDIRFHTHFKMRRLSVFTAACQIRGHHRP